MRLVEKSCPNCGASLEFNEKDKGCKCQYCKKSFEIERDSDNSEEYNLVYNDIRNPFLLLFAVPFIVIILAIVITSISMQNHLGSDHYSSSKINTQEEADHLITSADQLTNQMLETLERENNSFVNQSITGRHDTTYSYQKTGDPKLEKVYVLYQEDTNYLISIYKVMYHNYFNQSDVHTVYVPIIFEDVMNKGFNASLANGNNPAPEYYFNEEHSTYIYAYPSFDDCYNDVIKIHEEDFQITEK